MVPSQGHAPVPVPRIPPAYTYARPRPRCRRSGLAGTQAPDSSTTIAAGHGHLDQPGQWAMVPSARPSRSPSRPARRRWRCPTSSVTPSPQATATLQTAGLTVAGVTGDPSKTAKGTDPPTGTTVPTGSVGHHPHPLSTSHDTVVTLPFDPSCDLCEAARLSEWHHEDDVCWVADCEVCGVPMVVWKHHGAGPAGPRRRPHDGAADAGWPTPDSAPGGGRSTGSCARSPTTSTPTGATRTGGSTASVIPEPAEPRPAGPGRATRVPGRVTQVEIPSVPVVAPSFPRSA